MVPSALSTRLYDPTDEHALLRQTVRQFALDQVEPQAMAHDESGTLNVALLKHDFA